MKRHRFDALSFTFGVAFIALAGGLSMAGVEVEAGLLRWFGAGLLLLFGLAMLVTSRSGPDDA
jgi:hypothetical protein